MSLFWTKPKYCLLVRSEGISISLVIWAITLSHFEEYLDKELKVEKAVVLIAFDSLPDVYMIASKIYYTFEF